MKSINIGAQVKMFKNTGMVLFVVLQVISELIVNWHSASATQRHASLSANGGGDIDGKRDKRFVLPFPTSSTVGLIAAVAMPVDIPNREVFFSYNFEANYNMPDAPFVANPFKEFGFIGRGSDNTDTATAGNSTMHKHSHAHKKLSKNYKKKTAEKSKKTKQRRSLLSRKTAYNIFERKLISLGFNGRGCMLKAICQSSETPLGHYNGVLGDILHIILTPTSSRDDDITHEYYEAEYNGLLGDCRRYDSNCPKSVIEFISIIK